jgi:hypothetical protein
VVIVVMGITCLHLVVVTHCRLERQHCIKSVKIGKLLIMDNMKIGA